MIVCLAASIISLGCSFFGIILFSNCESITQTMLEFILNVLLLYFDYKNIMFLVLNHNKHANLVQFFLF